jgi:hypothetical protein
MLHIATVLVRLLQCRALLVFVIPDPVILCIDDSCPQGNDGRVIVFSSRATASAISHLSRLVGVVSAGVQPRSVREESAWVLRTRP